MRLWRSWSRARAPSPCNEPGRAVKPGRGGVLSSQWGALCLPRPCPALCCSHGEEEEEEEWGDAWVGQAPAARWVSPAPPALPARRTLALAPRGRAPGCAAAPRFPVSFRCSFPRPYTHPKIV